MQSVDLIWLAKTPEGWKRFPVVMGRNGRIKRGAVLVDGKERSYPDGHFELRFYEARKTVYKNVGTDATEAVNERDRMQSLGEAKASAAAAGVTVNESEVRRLIKAEAARFVKDAKDRGAMESADVNRAAMGDFQQANPKLTYVDEIDKDSTTTFWRYLKKQGNGDRTIYNAHMRLTGFLKFAGVDYKAWRLGAPRYEEKLPDMYSKDEMQRMLASCKREYNRVMISILAQTGLRDQELMHLYWTDIDFSKRAVRVTGKPECRCAPCNRRDKKGWHIKNYEQRDIPLPVDLVEMLKGWRKKNPKATIILPTSTGRPNTKLLNALKSVAKNAKVPNATLHRFRRTYCTTLLRGGMDLRTAQLLMGHKDLASTMRYLTPATGDEVMKKIDMIKLM